MQDRTSVANAQNWIDEQSITLGTERVSSIEACGRVLCEELTAGSNVPAFPRAMMDGYAVIAAQTAGAGEHSPALFNICGEQLPGQPVCSITDDNSAVRITTGSPMPDGTDAVIPVEHTRQVGSQLACEIGLAVGKNVGQEGEDLKAGEVVYRPGRKLRPQDIGVLVSLGITKITVQSKPRVNIVVTGNELVLLGEQLTQNSVYDVNGPMLKALVTRDGGTPILSGIIPDDRKLIEAAMAKAADVILVSGGSSAGHEDFAPEIVTENGQLPIHGVSMRPSSPAGMGIYKDKLVFLLPGNPVSCLCAYDFFAGRKIRHLSSGKPEWPYMKFQGTLVHKIVSSIGRTDYARVVREGNTIIPLSIGGASVLSTTTRADGFIVVKPESEGIAAGSKVDVYLYD